MKFILVIAALFSMNAFAADYQTNELKFTITDRANDGNLVYYNCDSAEWQIEVILEKMGARNVRVVCRGGLDRFGSFNQPARISVNFEALSADIISSKKVSYQEVKLRNRRNCHFVNTVVESVAPSFDIKSLDIRRCSSVGSSTRIVMEVLKEDS